MGLARRIYKVLAALPEVVVVVLEVIFAVGKVLAVGLGGVCLGFVLLAAAVVHDPCLFAFDCSQVSDTEWQMMKVGADLDMYAAKHKGRYPSTAEGLSAARAYFPDHKVPTDDWGNPFLYFSPARTCQKAYELVSTGEDGERGGEDRDADLSSCHPDGLTP